MSNNLRSRHAAPSVTSRLAGRAVIGVIGAPVALFAATGPADAAEFAPDLTSFGAAAMPVGAADVAPPALDISALDTSALPQPVALPGLDQLPDAASVAGMVGHVEDVMPTADGAHTMAAPNEVDLPDAPTAEDLTGMLSSLGGAHHLAPTHAADVDSMISRVPGTDRLPAMPSASDVEAFVTQLPGADRLSSSPDAVDVEAFMSGLPGADKLHAPSFDAPAPAGSTENAAATSSDDATDASDEYADSGVSDSADDGESADTTDTTDGGSDDADAAPAPAADHDTFSVDDLLTPLF